MKPSSLLYIDKFLSVPNELFDLVYKVWRNWFPLHQKNDENILVLKLIGMGSLIKLTALLHENKVDLSKVTLCTFEQNKEIAQILGYTHIVELSTDWMRLFKQCLLLPFNTRYTTVFDVERDVNATSIFRKYLSILGKSDTIYYSHHRDRRSENDYGFDINTRTHMELFEEVLRFFPKNKLDYDTEKEFVLQREKKILININASDYLSARKYPIEKYVQLIQDVAKKYSNYRLILTGAKAEQKYVLSLESALLVKGIKIENVCGKWNLSKFQAELKTTSVFITNDSGPMHLAVWLQTPTVTIWGPTHQNYSGYPESEIIKNASLDLPCSPCFIGAHSKWGEACNQEVTCMNQLGVSKVLNKIDEILWTR